MNTTDELTGDQAHAEGLPISACPYAPADTSSDAHEWRRSWLMAEAAHRRGIGTYGASDDEYRQAGLNPPARTSTGAPVCSFDPARFDELAVILGQVVDACEGAALAVARAVESFSIDTAPLIPHRPMPETRTDRPHRWAVLPLVR